MKRLIILPALFLVVTSLTAWADDLPTRPAAPITAAATAPKPGADAQPPAASPSKPAAADPNKPAAADATPAVPPYPNATNYFGPSWLRDVFGTDAQLQTSPYMPEISVGAGGAAVFYTGNKVKIGEWQDVYSSPIFDADGLLTNGLRTLNFHLTGTDNETTSAAFDLYGPRGKVNADFERFIHRRDHIPLDNLTSTVAPLVRHQDLNVGDDYAVRVDEIKMSAQGNLNEHIKVRVDVFDMHRFGERQANAIAHCFAQQGLTGRSCHVLSQRQTIDWNTVQITPRVEARYGPLTIEYSRPMTVFSANDQVVTRQYNGSTPVLLQGTWPYAVVPNNMTQIDQLRIGYDLSPATRFYSYAYAGHTDDFARDVERDFVGADFRLTNCSFSDHRFTAYSRFYYQAGVRPNTFLPDETQGLTLQQANDNIASPIGYVRSTVGVQDRWVPGFDNELFRYTAITSGYQWDYLHRNNAVFEQSAGAFTFFQPDTVTNTIHIGVDQPWTAAFSTYMRYKVLFVSGPLYGFREDSGQMNSNQPQQQHIIEFGQTWAPNNRFALMADQQFDLSWHVANNPNLSTNRIRFDEQSYAFQVAAWYAVTQQLSFSASCAFFNNWINQNIVLATDYIEPGNPDRRLITPITRPWEYGGTSSAFNVRGSYMLTPTVRLIGGYEYVLGQDQILNNSFADLWPDLNQYSRVIVQTQRVFTGVDWSPRERMSVYFRYNFYDYQDRTATYNTGTLHAFLVGGSVFF